MLWPECAPSGSTSAGVKKKRCPGWRRDPEVAPRVGFEHDREVHVAVDVLVQRLHDRLLPGQRRVEHVPALPRPQPHEAPRARRARRRRRPCAARARRARPSPRRSSGAHLPLADRPRAGSSAPRATAPRCGRGSPARGVEARISAFSASVRLRMLRIRSWSISPPSKRSPGLSGAICGWSDRMIGDDSSVGDRPPPHEDRPGADVLAGLGGRAQRRRRIGERHERAPLHAQHRVRRAQRPAAAPPRAGRRARACGSRSSPSPAALRRPRARRRRGPCRAPPPTTARARRRRPGAPPRGRPGRRSAPRCRPPARPAATGPSATSRSVASSHVRWRSAPWATSSTSRPPASTAWRQTTCSHRTADRQARRRVALHQALRLHDPGVVAGRATLRVRAREDAAEGPALRVLERRAAVGPQHVALVENGVGDGPHGIGHGASAASAGHRARPPSWAACATP
jgi:hypothetical protein